MRLLHSGMLMLTLLANSGLPAGQQTRPETDARAQPLETYDSADVDGNGNLRITTSDRRRILVPKEGKQSSFSKPTVSSDRTAVGAQADYPNCCTSYDIPLELVVYSRGKVHRFKGIGLPILQWQFADGGTRIAYGQEPVHFACETHYELRDIDSERLIDSAKVPQPCGQHPDPAEVTIPKWVQELRAALKARAGASPGAFHNPRPPIAPPCSVVHVSIA